MLSNYLLIAWRNLLRHKALSFINIFGLGIGLSACLLIFLYVQNELSYDAYHPKADRIARVTTVLISPESNLSLATTCVPLASALAKDYAGIEATARIEQANIAVRHGRDVFDGDDFYYSESSVFQLFEFHFLEGAPATALSMPNSLVLTERMARKFFGSGSALGKVLVCNGRNFQVTGVIKDRPANSDIHINVLMWKDFSKSTNWTVDDFDTYTFVLFKGKADLAMLNGHLKGLVNRYIQPELVEQKAMDYKFHFETEMLRDVHFSKGKLIDTPKGDRQFNRIFSVLAVFILVIALLNYINLATARATERMKEVGIRKVIGARPWQLIRQFLGESALLVGLAWLIAMGLTALALPLFNRIFSIELKLDIWLLVSMPLVFIPVTTLLAGAYPAFVLTKFRPVKSLKGVAERDPGGARLRQILTTIQFVIAMGMLAGTVVSWQQMQFITHQDTGVDRSGMICMGIPQDSVSQAVAPGFFQALRKESALKGVTVGSGLPAEGVMMSSTTAWSGGKKRSLMCNYFFIDPAFLSLVHIRLEKGRNFSDSLTTDKSEGFIVNEAFAATMGWKEAIGQPIEGGFGRKGKVIGVVKNFFFKSVHNIIEPVLMVYRPDPTLAVLVKGAPTVLSRLKEVWKSFYPTQPFNSFFMDENFNDQYKRDKMTLTLFNTFTGLAILISCLGLYGLVSLVTLQRMKEIGIRKVLGANVGRLVFLLSKEQLWLIALAAAVGIPLAMWGVQRWLSDYAYHVPVRAWMFAAPVVFLLGLSMIVTGYRIMRAALANPIHALRAE